MVPEDRIVYQAVIDFISRRIEEPPAECVYSYRLNSDRRSSNMFKFWRPLWLRMRKKMREMYANGYCCLLKSDIAAYFEHIDHHILRTNILNSQVEETKVLDLLNKLLRKWSASDVKHIGIPQGSDASSYIGNLYLINLDKIMKREGLIYFRYSDEIYIFTANKREARKAIKVITNELRRLHLNLQEAKTEIYTESQKIKEQIGSDVEDKTKEFDYTFQRQFYRNDVEVSAAEILKEYKKVTKNGRAKIVDISKFKWCINRLGKLKSDKAVNFILKRLGDLPFLADLLFKYLKIFVNRKCVKDGILNFLTSQDNIYEWQEMWLLITLFKTKKTEEHQINIIRRIISDSKYWTSKVASVLVLGKLGDDTDRNWLRGLYSAETDNCIKRAIAVSVYELPESSRNQFYDEIKRECYEMERLVKYLKSGQIKTI